jgi:hypothetical protein
MGLFNFFKKDQTAQQDFGDRSESAFSENKDKEIPKSEFVDEGVPHSESPDGEIRDSGSEPNLDYLYRFLDKSYEDVGYNDALRNPDTSHMEENIKELRFALQRTFEKTKKYYYDLIREINFHIESRSRSGMIDTVDELKMKKGKAEEHIDRINEIENQAKNGEGISQGLILSYARGFKNGLAAITHHSVLKNNY